MKIRDRIILGVISGLIAGIPGRLINAVEYKENLTDIRYNQLAASLFIPKNKTNTIEGKALASFVNNINLGVVGVMTTYILSLTGRDKAIIKGMGTGAISWIMLNGVVSNLGLGIKSKKPISPILSFADHVIFGLLTGYLISKLGDDALFPDDKENSKDKIPIIATNTNPLNGVNNDKRTQ